MKQLYFLVVFFALSFIIMACNAGAGKTKASDSANATQDIINAGGASSDSAGAPGSKLISANDCFTCHKMNEKNFGPSYMQIAQKYDYNQGNIENLADRIRKGGKGLWGNNAMNPHPNLSEPEAEAMAKYILSLNTADTNDTTNVSR